MGKDKWKVVLDCQPNRRLGCKSNKWKKSQEEWWKSLTEMKKGLRFKQSSLIACSQLSWRCAAEASSTLLQLEIKFAVQWIEP